MLPASKVPGQIWVLHTQESNANYPLQGDADFASMFDMRMTFELDAHVPVTYADR